MALKMNRMRGIGAAAIILVCLGLFVSGAAAADDKWARATDKKEQRKILDDIQIRALETVPYVPYGQHFQPIAVRSNVRGVLKAGLPVYWNIEKR